MVVAMSVSKSRNGATSSLTNAMVNNQPCNGAETCNGIAAAISLGFGSNLHIKSCSNPAT